MRKISQHRKLSLLAIISLFITLAGYLNNTFGGETQWLAVGRLHDWYHSAGCEIEVGRTYLISDQQDGLKWPAQFRYQDSKAAKALWIGTINYNDPIANKTFPHKVVHIGPRFLDEENEFMSQEFTLHGRFDHPSVVVDGLLASELGFIEEIDPANIDPNLPADRMIYNVVNTSIGITMTRKIYAFSQQYHDNYFIYDYVFKNTGIIDMNGTENPQTLEGVVFFFQYRYAPSREGGPYGEGYWLPQSTSWGHSTMNDAIFTHPETGDAFRTLFTWLGKHSGWQGPGDNIGGPNFQSDGHLGAPQYVGVITLHADKSANDKSDDPNQPFTTRELGSDEGITDANSDQFNGPRMTQEYAVMTAGRPDITQAQAVGDGFADLYGNTPGGFSQTQGFGPYTLAPGDSIHIVIVEGVAGLGRAARYEIGANWLEGAGPFELPDGSTTNDANEYKNEWVFTGKDSLFQTFDRATLNYESNFNILHPPPPPDEFTVTSGGDRISLTWSNNAESWPGFAGYRIYRAIHIPDTTYDEIFACGLGTENPTIVNLYDDKEAARGFDYYYYMVSFDDGSNNNSPLNPGGSLHSSRFYTQTNEPATLKREAGRSLDEIRVVPNPFNIRARELQFGRGAPDRILFVDIPPFCNIKIFTERGDLVQAIEHTDGSGDEAWNSVTSSRQVVVSGVYIAYFVVTEDYHDPDTGELLYKKGENAIRKFVIIR